MLTDLSYYAHIYHFNKKTCAHIKKKHNKTIENIAASKLYGGNSKHNAQELAISQLINRLYILIDGLPCL